MNELPIIYVYAIMNMNLMKLKMQAMKEEYYHFKPTWMIKLSELQYLHYHLQHH